MIDRTDLQLMLLEQICDMETEELIELFQHLTGEELEICVYEKPEEMIGSIETLDLSDAPRLKNMLCFLLYALGERVEMPVAD